ncbi:MAG: hypothetical protein Q8Q89_05340 [bacterium]|nr:hypothetical protein [bacterium]
MNIEIKSPEEAELKKALERRDDAEAKRLLRFLNMPDLSRTEGSPIKELVDNMTAIFDFKDFDIVQVPEIVPTDVAFDLFDFAPDHPVRSKSDTYFIDEKNILRPHTTVMWYYYLTSDRAKGKMLKGEPIGVFSYGKVYRKDEIDKFHMNVFHQIDGLYLCLKKQKEINLKDLQEVEANIVRAVFGKDVKYRFHEETFPYTHPSTEVEVEKDGEWLEILGSGVVKGSVLEKLGVDSDQYNGWALGPGLERWAMISMALPDIRLLWSEDPRIKKQLKLGNKYVPHSKYPPITRDISFVVANDFIPNNYFDLIRDLGGDLAEEVKLIDKYENPEKFGAGKTSYAYRIIFRSNDRTLTSGEVDKIMSKIYAETAKQFNAELR